MRHERSEALIVKGSLQDRAGAKRVTLADAIMEVEALVLVDSSGSMAARVRGMSAHQCAARELGLIQRAYPGKVAVISWSSTVEFCPNGVPTQLNGGTDMAAALRYIKDADGLVRMILISDGCPDSEAEALQEAQDFKHGIDTIFIGEEWEAGAQFLRRLSALTRGKYGGARDVMKLAEGIKLLMEVNR